jgi:hypothetical protein
MSDKDAELLAQEIERDFTPRCKGKPLSWNIQAFVENGDIVEDSTYADISQLFSLLDAFKERGDEIARMREALKIIERWDDFPPSGKQWPGGAAMSYGAAFGSNGERDFMRGIARAALDETK